MRVHPATYNDTIMADSFVKDLESLEIVDKDFTPEFPLFPTLPTEIRFKIWSIALRVPRTLAITCEKPTFKSLAPGVPRSAQSFRCDQRPPVLLHINRESRAEALAFYKPFFKTSRASIRNTSTYISGQSYIYVSFPLDTLRFTDLVLSYLAGTELQGIQSLILDVKDCAYFGHYNMELVKQMKSLKTLDMWADRGANASWDVRDAYLRYLTQSFEETKEIDPGWECPVVRIFNRESKLLVGNIEGGAVIPGWTE